jgi:integrase
MRLLRDYTHFPMQFLLWLRKSKTNSVGTAPIMLRVFLHTNDRAEYSTGIRCKPDQWNAAKGSLRGTDEASRTYNKLLDKLVAKANLLADRMQDERDADSSLPPLRPAQVVEALKPKARPVEPSLLDRLQQALPSAPGAPATKSNLAKAYNAFAAWPTSKTMNLAHCTPVVMQHYASYLNDKYSHSTRSGLLSCLARLLRHACPEHPPVLDKVRKGNGEPARKRALSMDWLEKLRTFPLTPSQNLARVIFFLQFYLHGSRVSAVLTLRRDQVDWQHGRLRFTAMKVEHHKDVQLRPELLALLEPYREGTGTLLLPVLPANYFTLDKQAQFTALTQGRLRIKCALGRVGKLIGWPGSLHPHLARHSLALRAYQVSGDLRLAQEMLGHSDVAMTAKYIASLSTDELDKGANSVYDSLL